MTEELQDGTVQAEASTPSQDPTPDRTAAATAVADEPSAEHADEAPGVTGATGVRVTGVTGAISASGVSPTGERLLSKHGTRPGPWLRRRSRRAHRGWASTDSSASRSQPQAKRPT